jgi:putative lipoic acid-binding regulatory protein
MPSSDLLDYPCRTPIKVFGKNDDEFHAAALAIVRSHFDGLREEDIVRRQSSAGRFSSLTITVRAESRDQLDAVYRELSASEPVIMVL